VSNGQQGSDFAVEGTCEQANQIEVTGGSRKADPGAAHASVGGTAPAVGGSLIPASLPARVPPPLRLLL